MKKILFIGLLVSGFLAAPASANVAERAEILSVVETFLAAQRERDAEAWRQTMLDEATIVSHREREGDIWVLAARTARGDLKRLVKGDVVIDEKIYAPTVMIHKTMATVWAPYDIYVNDKLLHCGIDLFTLFKVEGQWKISHFAYTTEPDGCEGLGIEARK